jgi:TonB-linked SusC/RagA family outer membrane protein
MTQEINRRVTVTSNTGITYRVNDMMQAAERNGYANSSMMRSMLKKPPVRNYPVDPTFIGTLEEWQENDSPISWLEDFQDKSKEFRAISSLTTDIKIADPLIFRFTGGGDFRSKSRQMFWGPHLFIGRQNTGRATYGMLRAYNYDIESLLLYKKKFGANHRLDATAGVTYDYSYIENEGSQQDNFYTFALGVDGISLGSVRYPLSLQKSSFATLSQLARINYSFMDRYIITVTGRRDGSSKFAEGHKYGFFPSTAFAWRVDKENFMESLPFISSLKLRLGWGQTGVQSVGPYQTTQTYSPGIYPNSNESLMNTATPASFVNPLLTWETSTQTNGGIDVGLFKNRLNLVIDVYKKQSKDLLQSFPIPPSTGYTTIASNLGSISNRGVEFSVDATVMQKKDFSWSIGGNISFNRNRIEELGIPVSQWGLNTYSAFMGESSSATEVKDPLNIFIEGKPVALFWGYQTNGIVQSTDKNLSVYKGATLKPGDIKFVDQNGDGLIDQLDKTIIGDPNPKFTYGFNTSVSYKNFHLDALFNGVYDRDIANFNLIYEEFSATKNYNMRTDAWANAWRPNAETNLYPRLGYGRITEMNDRIIEDGSYLRLGYVALSYNLLPANKKVFSRLTFNLMARNLFTITDYKGYDPEVNSFSTNGGKYGMDYNAYPNLKSYSAGIELGF